MEKGRGEGADLNRTNKMVADWLKCRHARGVVCVREYHTNVSGILKMTINL